MDAQILWRVGVVLPLLLLTTGANYETANFVVNAPSAESARQFAETAEQFRNDLAILWLGKTLPDWSEKCPVKVHVGNDLGAGGKTSFVFENGEVFDWEMEIQGSHERILDSVLPHEITHMILASHFRMPIPRWLDEGMATSVEDNSEKANYRRLLQQFLKSNVPRCFPFNRMVAMKEYPADPMPFYAQGLSVVEYLLELGGQFDDNTHRRLVRFAHTAMQDGNWKSALQEHYDMSNLGELQTNWVKWVGTNAQALPATREPATVSPVLSPTVLPVASVSAKPLPSYGKSVYDRRVEPILTQENEVKPVPIPTSFERDTVLR